MLLRLGAGLLFLAAPTALLPEAWMASTHRWLGLGEFPASPLVSYLTRSVAGIYTVHGGILAVASTDVRRYAALIRYLAWGNVAFGAALVAIDLHAGLPLWWTAIEGPPLVATGLALSRLLSALKRSPA